MAHTGSFMEVKSMSHQEHVLRTPVLNTRATSLRQGVSIDQSQTNASKKNQSSASHPYPGSRPACSYWLQRSWWWGSPGRHTGSPRTCAGQHPQPPPSQYPGDTMGMNTFSTDWRQPTRFTLNVKALRYRCIWNSFIWTVVFAVIKYVLCDTCINYEISNYYYYFDYFFNVFFLFGYYDYCVQKQTVVYKNINIIVVPVAWIAEQAHANVGYINVAKYNNMQRSSFWAVYGAMRSLCCSWVIFLT